MIKMSGKIEPTGPGGEMHLHHAILTMYNASRTGAGWDKVAGLLAAAFSVDAVVLCHTEGDSVRVLGEGLYNVTPEDAAKLPHRYALKDSRETAHHSGTCAVRTVDDAGFAREIDRLPAPPP